METDPMVKIPGTSIYSGRVSMILFSDTKPRMKLVEGDAASIISWIVLLLVDFIWSQYVDRPNYTHVLYLSCNCR